MIFFHVICGLLFMILRGSVEDLNDKYKIITYAIGTLWGISFLFGVCYIISAILKNTQKTFALALVTVLPLFVFMLNVLIIITACNDFYGLIEWIPVLFFEVLSGVWLGRTIIKVRKEMWGKEVTTKIPFWLVFIVIVSLTPFLTFLGRKKLGYLLPGNLFVYYMSYVIFLFNIISAKYIVNLFVYCKITLFGRKYKNG